MILKQTFTDAQQSITQFQPPFIAHLYWLPGRFLCFSLFWRPSCFSPHSWQPFCFHLLVAILFLVHSHTVRFRASPFTHSYGIDLVFTCIYLTLTQIFWTQKFSLKNNFLVGLILFHSNLSFHTYKFIHRQIFIDNFCIYLQFELTYLKYQSINHNQRGLLQTASIFCATLQPYLQPLFF